MSDRPPDLTGPGHSRRFDIGDSPPQVITGPWSAWMPAVPDEQKRANPAGLSLWLLHAPGAHPHWSWHMMAVTALRDFPGVPPAKLHAVGNTHEIVVGAIDPAWDPRPWIDNLGDPSVKFGSRILRPTNMVHQLSAITDDQAIELGYLLVRAFCQGLSSPDDDFKTKNIAMITATADHLRRGMHMPS